MKLTVFYLLFFFSNYPIPSYFILPCILPHGHLKVYFVRGAICLCFFHIFSFAFPFPRSYLPSFLFSQVSPSDWLPLFQLSY